jgi:hypothetical protein
MRCHTVIELAAAKSANPMSRLYGTPSPARPAAPKISISLVARPASPLSQRKPRASARAFAKDITTVDARQYIVRTASVRSLPPEIDQAASAIKMAASATRSSVGSRKAPKVVAFPFTLASAPSSKSASEKIVQNIAPASRWPVGKSIRELAETPIVPMIVSAFGVTGVRARTFAAGVNMYASAGLTESTTLAPLKSLLISTAAHNEYYRAKLRVVLNPGATRGATADTGSTCGTKTDITVDRLRPTLPRRLPARWHYGRRRVVLRGAKRRPSKPGDDELHLGEVAMDEKGDASDGHVVVAGLLANAHHRVRQRRLSWAAARPACHSRPTSGIDR